MVQRQPRGQVRRCCGCQAPGIALSPGRRELWKEIMPADPAGVYRFAGAAISPDGRAYAYSYIQQLADLHVVEGLR